MPFSNCAGDAGNIRLRGVLNLDFYNLDSVNPLAEGRVEPEAKGSGREHDQSPSIA